MNRLFSERGHKNQQGLQVSSQYPGVGAGLALAHKGDRKGSPLPIEKIRLNVVRIESNLDVGSA